MRSKRQLVATDGNGFGLFEAFWARRDLPLVAMQKVEGSSPFIRS